MKKKYLFLFEKYIDKTNRIFLNVFIFLIFCLVKTECYTDYKGVYIYNNKYYLILSDQIIYYQKGTLSLPTIQSFNYAEQKLNSEKEFEMINIVKYNNNKPNILFVKSYYYSISNDDCNCYESINKITGYIIDSLPYKYTSSYSYFFLGFINNNILNLYLYSHSISNGFFSKKCSSSSIASLSINNVDSENFSCQIMKSSSDEEVLTCFYQILDTKKIIASSFSIDISSETIENITSLSKWTETNGANYIKSNIYADGTKAFVCFINDDNNCDCSIYDIINNEWSNYKTYLNNCMKKKSAFKFDYYEITDEYFLYCLESTEKFSLVKFNNTFEITKTANFDLSKSLKDKQCYFLTMVYDKKNISAIINCDTNYTIYLDISPVNNETTPSTLMTTPSTFLSTLPSSLPETFLVSTIPSSTTLSASLEAIPSTILFSTIPSISTNIEQNILISELTYFESTIQTTSIEYSTTDNIQNIDISTIPTLSSSIIQTTIIEEASTIISSLIISSLIENEPTVDSTLLPTSLIETTQIAISSLIQTSTIEENSNLNSTIFQTQELISSLIQTSIIEENSNLSSTIIQTEALISSVIETTIIVKNQILITDSPTHEISMEITSILTTLPIINDYNNKKVIVERSDKTKEEIMQNLDTVMENYDVGEIYEIFGEDYSIKISPINTRVYSNISTYIQFSNCENILREKNGLSQSSILTVYQIEIDNFNENSLINKVEYAVFNENKDRLDLSVCEDEKIEINYQIDSSKINKTKVDYYSDLGVDVFDIEDEFFNDICYSYSENDADMILTDRVNHIYQNYSLCESNCEYDKINLTDNLVTCQCSVKTNADIIEKPLRLDTIIRNSFEESNIAVIKCYSLVFSLKNKSRNIGFWIFTILVTLHIPNFIYYFIFNIVSIRKFIFNEMSKFHYLYIKSNPKKKGNNIYNLNLKDLENKEKIIVKEKKNKKDNKKDKEDNSNSKEQMGKNPNVIIVNNKIIIKHRNKISRNNTNKFFSNISSANSKSIQNMSKNELLGINQKMKEKNKKSKTYKSYQDPKVKTVEKIKDHDDKRKDSSDNALEDKDNKYNLYNYSLIQIDANNSNNKEPPYSNLLLDNYDYDTALIYDKRSFRRIFFICILAKENIANILLFKTPLDLRPLRFCNFIFSYSSDLAFNTIFYTAQNISERYHYQGKNVFIFSLINNLIISIISSVVGLILVNIFQHMYDFRGNFEEVFRVEEKKMRNNKHYKVNKDTKVKMFNKLKNICFRLRCEIIFFIIFEFSIMIFFYYFVTAFCEVYKNTQISWLIDFFYSFIISFTCEIIGALIIAIFYILSLKYRIRIIYNTALFFYNL